MPSQSMGICMSGDERFRVILSTWAAACWGNFSFESYSMADFVKTFGVNVTCSWSGGRVCCQPLNVRFCVTSVAFTRQRGLAAAFISRTLSTAFA